MKLSHLKFTHLKSAFLAGVLSLLFCGLAGSRAAFGVDLSALEERAIKEAVARVAPSVVRIETVGGLERIGELLVGPGPTTGVVISDDGYIVSSAFNFAQKPDSVLVTLPDGRRSGAKLVATDHNRQLVLLKISTEGPLTPPAGAPLGEIRAGQWAIAVGRTYELASPSISVGIVSALDRVWGKAIQTDAKISPSNYGGPLVDIRGQVMGVLAPLTPESASEVAGVDWYDSGIGFAVPWEQVQSAFPRLKEGHDLRPGLLGISVKGTDIYAAAPIIAACRPGSPGAKAGWKGGDTIVEAGGKKITRQAELKHELGMRYAGDKISIVVDRAGEKIEREVELIDKLAPMEHAFLGILPMRPLEEEAAVRVRYVYPGSPADRAGIKAGDEIISCDGEEIGRVYELVAKMNSKQPGETVALEVKRGTESLKLSAELARTPDDGAPVSVPTAHAIPPVVQGERAAVGTIPIKLPEYPNECTAYVPQGYNPAAPCGVLVWLHAPGAANQQAIIDSWKPLCDKYEFILLAPKSADPKQWRPSESKLISRALAELKKTYRFDALRVVVHGYEGGGSLAYLLAGRARGVATVEAPLPVGFTPPEADLMVLTSFWIGAAQKSPQAPRIETTVKELRKLEYPVQEKKLGEQARYLLPAEQDELARWIDAIDRI